MSFREMLDTLGIDAEAASAALRKDTERRRAARKCRQTGNEDNLKYQKAILELKLYSDRSGKALVSKDDRALRRILEDNNIDLDKLYYNLSNRDECPPLLLKPKQLAINVWRRKHPFLCLFILGAITITIILITR
jgi:hypothetical protein